MTEKRGLVQPTPTHFITYQCIRVYVLKLALHCLYINQFVMKLVANQEFLLFNYFFSSIGPVILGPKSDFALCTHSAAGFIVLSKQ